MKFVSFLLFLLFGHSGYSQTLTKEMTRLCSVMQAGKVTCQQLSPFEKLVMHNMQVECEVSFDKLACAELANKLPPDSKDKIRSCQQDQICKGQTVPAGISCVIGGATFAWDTLVGIMTSPYQAVQAISESFDLDRACFENQKGMKEALLRAFDDSIPESHKQFRLNSDIKKAMIKQWSCREIKDHLMTKTRNYQAYIGPLVAQGKYEVSIDQSPLAKMVDSIRSELGLRWDCYTPAAKAEMNCYIMGSVLTGVVGGSLALRSKLVNFGIAEDRIVRAEAVAQKYYLKVQLTPEKPENFQLVTWKLREEGKIAQASALESKLIHDLESGKVVSSSDPIGLNGAQFVKLDNGVEGVWKPTEVLNLRGTLSHKNGAKYEVAAYEIDRKLGLNTVPVTVEKKLNGKDGSLQLRIQNIEETETSRIPLAFFDDLIANHDRTNPKNRFMSENHLVAIDHGLAFRDRPNESFVGNVELQVDSYKLAETAQEKERVLKRLQPYMPKKEVYERLVNTKDDEWKKLLSPYLPSKNITDFLQRRKKIIDLIEDARKEIGDRIFSDQQSATVPIRPAGP